MGRSPVSVEPVRDRRAERRESTKAEILEAAWAIVRADGLTALSLRDLARKVGMQAPSLYQYFDSKHAIYDAMFLQGNQALAQRLSGLEGTGDPVEELRLRARALVEFSVEDPARYQLLFQRTIPGFEPSPDSYGLAVELLQRARVLLTAAGLQDERALDLWTAVVAGLAAQQLANDPGGTRWVRLVDEAVDMFFTHMNHTRRQR
ncbi:MAG: TetR/AcrR family transcriptional regulator [Actinomycetota bacterium]|nr:TetR/AcrR family transcriptional regulator [Actinomycetota bacterium]